MILVIKLKKLTATQELTKLKRKYLTTTDILLTQEFNNKLTAEHFAARLKQANAAMENYIADFVKRSDFDKKN